MKVLSTGEAKSERTMTTITFSAGDRSASGYQALPEQPRAPGVLVLHAWWGLNETFTDACDRLARAGFVALAPDLYEGKVVTTIEAAHAQMQQTEQRNYEATHATVLGALRFLRSHPTVNGTGVGVVGFSMGAAWALQLSAEAPDDIAAVVVFYGTNALDFGDARAAYQGHFASDDEFEPSESVRELEDAIRATGREVQFHTYEGNRHWFVEPNRPEYDAAATELAWQRTIDFLREQLQGTS
jgi:carboxymethylenebutenolidase